MHVFFGKASARRSSSPATPCRRAGWCCGGSARHTCARRSTASRRSSIPSASAGARRSRKHDTPSSPNGAGAATGHKCAGLRVRALLLQVSRRLLRGYSVEAPAEQDLGYDWSKVPPEAEGPAARDGGEALALAAAPANKGPTERGEPFVGTAGVRRGCRACRARRSIQSPMPLPSFVTAPSAAFSTAPTTLPMRPRWPTSRPRHEVVHEALGAGFDLADQSVHEAVRRLLDRRREALRRSPPMNGMLSETGERLADQAVGELLRGVANLGDQAVGEVLRRAAEVPDEAVSEVLRRAARLANQPVGEVSTAPMPLSTRPPRSPRRPPPSSSPRRRQQESPERPLVTGVGAPPRWRLDRNRRPTGARHTSCRCSPE